MEPHPASVTQCLVTCMEPYHQVPLPLSAKPYMYEVKSSNWPWMGPKSTTTLQPHPSIRLPVASLIPPWREWGKGDSQPQTPPPFLTLLYGCVPNTVASKDPLLLAEGPAGPPLEHGRTSSPVNWESHRRLRNSQGCGHRSSKHHDVSGTLLVSHASCPGPR